MSNSEKELKSELSALCPIHFVGAAGSGMRPLAEFTHALGMRVSGSERKIEGIKSSFLMTVENSESDKKLVINAKTIVYSSAISNNHPSLELAKESKINVIHRSELLAMISRHYKTIAVAGTHGKSTTSAMVAHMLQTLGQSPSWIIGAPFAHGHDSFSVGRGPWLVIEADESDGSFLRYRPFVSILTNVDADHMDYYQTVDRLHEAFRAYVQNTDPLGGVVVCGDHTSARQCAEVFAGLRISYGFDEANDLIAFHYKAFGLSASSKVMIGGKSETLSLPLPGKHNTSNALAAIGAGQVLGLPLSQTVEALASFPGVRRRMQRYETRSGVIIFDDYAHNPVKIASCIQGLEEAFPDRRLIVCFQPHRFSRISGLYADFISCFRARKILVIVLPVYASGEAPIKGFEPPRIATDIAKASGAQTFSASTFKGCAELIKSFVVPEQDLIATIGAGDVWQIARSLSLEL